MKNFILFLDLRKVFNDNIKNVNSLLKNKIEDKFINNFTFESALDKNIFNKFKNNIKEKALNQTLNDEFISIFDEMKKNIIGNINNNFNKIYDITSINFIFNKEQLFNSIYESIKKSNPFNAEKIKSLKHHMLIKKKFSLIDCQKITRILNGVIDKKGKFNENLFNCGKDRFEQFINLEILSLDIPTEVIKNVSSVNEIDFKEFKGNKKEVIINVIKNLGNSVSKFTLINFKKELKCQISDLINKEIEKIIDDIFDLKIIIFKIKKVFF